MVDALFHKRWPEGNKFATVEVAEYVSRRTGHNIDRQYIYRIKTGRVRKVDAQVLDAIAAFFGQPLTYFSEEQAHIEDAELAAALDAAGMQIVGLRSRELTPIARQELLRLIRMTADVLEQGG
ncbi:helix-turn-helix transcriptional regulator [Nocardia sp. CC227C]|uniref:helix-turn-helix domain-containing protein n=1 Tax=Nocardia sp. CC227C TaxID=3044562 RepID=UPI00278C2FE3|nr:helix-turn-helix transcriptional regulator [Nocardia sp. CC227C]